VKEQLLVVMVGLVVVGLLFLLWMEATLHR
jgi:hypothetical protein